MSKQTSQGSVSHAQRSVEEHVARVCASHRPRLSWRASSREGWRVIEAHTPGHVAEGAVATLFLTSSFDAAIVPLACRMFDAQVKRHAEHSDQTT
jgi:hypothetical protein